MEPKLTKEDVLTLIKGEIDKSTAFQTRKIGDTPTDNNQLTPKVYVDDEVSSVASSLDILSDEVSGISGSHIVGSFSSGEAIEEGHAISMGATPTASTAGGGVGVGFALDQNLTADDITTGANLWGQTYLATQNYLHKVDARIGWGGDGSWLFRISLQSTSAGLPTNTQIASASVLISSVGSSSVMVSSFQFPTPVKIDVGSTLGIVMNANNTTNNPKWEYTNSDVYTGGSKVKKVSGTWSADSTDDFAFAPYESNSISGKVYKSTASVTSNLNGELARNFLGFAKGSVTGSNQTLSVIVNGISSTKGGLTIGQEYYLSNTPGELSASAGSFSRKIGLAISGNDVLIKQDNVS